MNKTAKNSLVYLIGTIFGAVLGLAGTIILTRVLSQKTYAMYGLMVTFHTFVTMFVSFGFDSSYMRFYYNHQYTQKKYLVQCMKYPLIIMSVVALIIIEPGQHLIQFIYDTKIHYLTLIIIVIKFFFALIGRFTHLNARMEERAVNHVVSGIIGKSGFLALVLLLFFLGYEVTFDRIIEANMIMAIVAFLINFTYIRKILNNTNQKIEPINDTIMLKYGFPLMINNIIVLIVPMVEKLLVRNIAGWELLSIFTAASVFQTVVLTVSNTLSNIWTPLAFKYCDDESRFKPIMHTFGVIGTLLLALGTAFCILLRRWLVLLLDKNYYSVFIIAPAFVLAACFNILSVIYAVGINIRKKNSYLVFAPIFQLIVSVVLCYALIPTLGLVGIGISVFVSIAVNRIYSILIGIRLYGTGQKETKVAIIIAISTIIVFVSFFRTSLIADIIMFVILISATILVFNKDLKTTFYNFRSVLKQDKV